SQAACDKSVSRPIRAPVLTPWKSRSLAGNRCRVGSSVGYGSPRDPRTIGMPTPASWPFRPRHWSRARASRAWCSRSIPPSIASWNRIPRSEDPVFPIPIFNIISVYPGATPEDMEQLVVDKIEPKLRSLERVKKLTSRAEDGLAVLQLEFDPSVDADRKEDEVLREINALRPELPGGLARLD